MRLLRCHIVVLASLWFFTATGQENWIPNPGFEAYHTCPETLGNFKSDVVLWTCPTKGSTDYFNNCSKIMGTPENFNGKQLAHEGKAYAGFYAYAPDDYREYLQVPLKGVLRAGHTYEISFYISLAEGSDFAVNKFGLLFSNDSLNVSTRKELAKRYWYQKRGNKYHYLEVDYRYFYKDTRDWLKVSTRFEAKGFEGYLTLGNFKPNQATRKEQTKRRAFKGAYYYIDQVMLRDLDDASTPIEAEEILYDPPPFKIDALLAFSNLLFNFDTYQLSDSGKEELQLLAGYMVENKDLNIRIDGHTDNVGSNRYNTWLSSKRCEAVKEELIHQGVSRERIAWKAYGAEKPLADNTTAAGRAQNRRVAFELFRKEISSEK